MNNPFWPPITDDGEGRTMCCGAPLDGGEPTAKFLLRHRGGLAGYPMSPECLPAARLAARYHRYYARYRRVGRKRFRGCGSGMREFVL